MQILYAESGGTSLAYAVQSETRIPMIMIPGIISNLVVDDTTPELARFHERLASFGRLVRWDKRGTGLSDQSAAGWTQFEFNDPMGFLGVPRRALS